MVSTSLSLFLVNIIIKHFLGTNHFSLFIMVVFQISLLWKHYPHCSAELIDKKMPMMIADALLDAYETRDEDIFTYVSSCAGPDWTYNQYPNWATDKQMWENGIKVDKAGNYHINLRYVIEKQLRDRNILQRKTKYSKIDTIHNDDYYSNSASSSYGLNQPEKFGRNFVGAFYEEPKVKVKGR